MNIYFIIFFFSDDLCNIIIQERKAIAYHGSKIDISVEMDNFENDDDLNKESYAFKEKNEKIKSIINEEIKRMTKNVEEKSDNLYRIIIHIEDTNGKLFLGEFGFDYSAIDDSMNGFNQPALFYKSKNEAEILFIIESHKKFKMFKYNIHI